MLRLPEGVRIWVATAPRDMRKQADGLSALVEGSLGQAPKPGYLFVFFSRRKDFVRILFWGANSRATNSALPDPGADMPRGAVDAADSRSVAYRSPLAVGVLLKERCRAYR